MIARFYVETETKETGLITLVVHVYQNIHGQDIPATWDYPAENAFLDIIGYEIISDDLDNDLVRDKIIFDNLCQDDKFCQWIDNKCWEYAEKEKKNEHYWE